MRTLSLSLDLQGIVVRATDIFDVGNRGKGECSIGDIVAQSAAEGVAGGAARRRRGDVEVITVTQNMGTARARITGCQDDVSGQLALNVDIELLNASLFEVKILRLNSAGEVGGNGRCGKNLEAVGSADGGRCIPVDGGASRSGESTSAAKAKAIRFGEIGRVLPQALRTLIPGGIVENGVTSANRRLRAAERFPGDANARF